MENSGGFFCTACLVSKPLDDISPDERYCQGCYEVLENEKRVAPGPKDYWTKDGNFFIHYGKKYGVTKNLGTVCLGTATETSPDGAEALSEGREVVTKIPDKGIIPAPDIQNQGMGILLQSGRGRPRKTTSEPVSRMTEWRRGKEKQLELIPR